mgnify:CR=1 FL=1
MAKETTKKTTAPVKSTTKESTKTTPKKDVKLHPAYAMEYWKLRAFFEDDKTMKISALNDATQSCTITVDDVLKKAALESLLKLDGLKVNVVVSGRGISEHTVDYLLKNNPHYDHLEVAEKEGITWGTANMFKAEVMHYFSDDMFSPSSHTAILPYQLARELMGDSINFQTEIK